MAYDVRLVKVVTGETVIGKFTEDKIEDPAIIQTIPTEQGVQMMLLPYGYPFDQEMGGEISMEHVMFLYKSCPAELEKKYLETATNLTLATGATLKNLDKMGGGSGSGGGIIL